MEKNSIDEFMYQLPVVGIVMKRNYAYFKQNTAITNLIHIAFGLGLGLILANKDLFGFGMVLIIASLLGHVYAFMRGGNKSN